MSPRPFVLSSLAILLLASCYDQPVADNFGSTTPRIEPRAQSNSILGETETPVRIGELGRSFAACNAQGTVNARTAVDGILVRAAPFDASHGTGRLAPGARFFICSRSLDQRWLGVVYNDAGRADRVCGVAAPVPSRRDYDGPCRSGWVPSAQVRLTAGTDEAGTAAIGADGEASRNIAQPK